MAFPTFTLITCILLIILVVAATIAILFYLQVQGTYTYPSPWCWNDWICTSDTYNPVKVYDQLLTNCTPDKVTNKLNLDLCSCSWNAFYDPTNPNKFNTPPTTPIPNNCISAA